jgi:ABC-type transporter Mla MlaB component
MKEVLMGTIVLSENISIRNIKDFHREVCQALGGEGEIEIDCAGVQRVDLSVMQVILALARECRARKKVLKIKGTSKLLKEQMKLCGIIH